MRNIRWENGVLLYDCDGENCVQPGTPHEIPLDHLFAALETTMKEYVMQGDPRGEALDAAMQLIYETVYASKVSCPIGSDAPWHNSLERLLDMLEAHYAEYDKPAKILMN